MDADAVSMFDFYHDPGFVKIGQYIIANISYLCTGDHTYLHALEHSCNVGMVRLAQSMTKYVFYNYLDKL
jgi:cell division protein FtsI/penicillin-binding protein 2